MKTFTKSTFLKHFTKSGEKTYTSIESQLEKIGCLIEQQLDENSKGEIAESCASLNWEIIKLLNR